MSGGAAIGELFESIRNGMSVRQDKSGSGLPITRIETISQSVVDPARVGFAGLTERDAAEWILRPGDILFSHINSVEHVGKCAVYRGEPAQLVHGMNLLGMRCDPRLLVPEFAIRLLRSPDFRSRLVPFINRAVNQASISIGNLKGIRVAVPPIEEQRRVAKALDDVDALRAKRRRALALLDDLARSSFLDAFGDPVTNPMRWPTQKVGDIGQVITGNTPSRSDKQNFGTAVEWIKSDNINPAHLTVTTATEGLSEDGLRSARVVGPGALLVTCIAGSPNSIGNVAVADRRVAFNQQINALVPEASDFRFVYMQLKLGKRLVQEQSTGGMKGLVSKSRFAAIMLPVPPSRLQQDFAKLAQAVETEKANHRAHLAKLDELFLAVQSRAFAGTLFG